MDFTITGGQVLGEQGLEAGDLFVVDGKIADSPSPKARVVDAAGMIVAPGMIDLHGDGFERNLSPRPGVFFDVETALIETDRQLLVNGITTAYLALTISWEPGLRSLENARSLIDAWRRLRPYFVTDLRIQLRWELAALDAVEDVETWLHLDPKPTLAFNDHFSMLIDPKRRLQRDLSKYASRAGLTVADYDQLTKRTEARFDAAPEAAERLARAAAAAGVVCFAHDEMTAEARRANREMGVTVSEFPMTAEAAQEAVDHGEVTILGSPNVVRGGSHIGALDAEPAAIAGLCGALASDYFFPAMLGAAGKLIAAGDLSAEEAWSLVSRNPAKAAHLSDRGAIMEGADADIVFVQPGSAQPVCRGVIANGRQVFST